MPAIAHSLFSFLHLLSLVCWIGSVFFLSFFAAPAIFQTLDRRQAGDVVGAIFPKYYKLGYICSMTALVTLLAEYQNHPWFIARLAFLLMMTGCVFYSGLGILPRARDLKARIRAAADEKDRSAAEAEFKSLHGVSVRLNGTVLLAGLVLLWFTAQVG